MISTNPRLQANTTATRLPDHVGLIAGWGRFPILVAQALQQRGVAVDCIGIQGHVDESIVQYCDSFRVIGLTRLGAQIRHLSRRGARIATMAGKVHKTLLFQPRFLLHHVPDWQCVKTFFPHFVTGTRNRNDDALLTAVVDAFAAGGITIEPATRFIPELLMEAGHISGPQLSRSQHQDVEFAWRLAKEMGRLDVGQCVVVKGRAVLAVEAVEGTDHCIRRAGLLCPSGGFTAVKVAKPNQDMRFDVPTIGVGTVQTLAAAGGRVLAVEADRTIIVDRESVIRFAKRNGVSIVALHDEPVLAQLADAA